ncbi:hypothetical protein Vafri_4528 [Volvox africanus]|uniref:J domain-containing protein n=1 Tax=Volvox africanus TaxID=51714 RepID=A0A8J4AY42_9CHLO|nr:hypothetical protein Vafri_4528 [Volvox africanus]
MSGSSICPCCFLGVPCNADVATLQRAFRCQATRLHPDKGGDVTAFHQLQGALHTLLGFNTSAQTPQGTLLPTSCSSLLYQQPRPPGCCGHCCGRSTGGNTRTGSARGTWNNTSSTETAWFPDEGAEEQLSLQAAEHLGAARRALSAGQSPALAEQQLTTAIRLLTAVTGTGMGCSGVFDGSNVTRIGSASSHAVTNPATAALNSTIAVPGDPEATTAVAMSSLDDRSPAALTTAMPRSPQQQLAEAYELRALARHLQSKHAAALQDWELVAELCQDCDAEQ